MGSDEERATPQDLANARLAEGNTCAASLVGLGHADAAGRARQRGFEPEVTPHMVDVILDLRPNRIRLLLDESGTVVRA